MFLPASDLERRAGMNLPLATPWILEMTAFWNVSIHVPVSTSLPYMRGKEPDHIIGMGQGWLHEAELLIVEASGRCT